LWHETKLLENKVRLALAGLPHVEEKQMFRGTAFMVNGKLCVSAGDNELMFRFDPALHESLVQQQGCREMMRNGKAIKGYLYVNDACLTSEKALRYWITLALDFNKKAKRTKKRATE
jgi:TfoX/Sxy family transcriptional regulator of competence genes